MFSIIKVNTPNEYKHRFYPARGKIFQFRVRCANDCTIRLSSKPQSHLPAHEIVIGAWSNTKSTIFKDKNVQFELIVLTPSILMSNEFRGFWISWYDNVIRVGREGEAIPFMSYKEPNLYPVEYVGICTAFGSTGSWLIDGK